MALNLVSFISQFLTPAEVTRFATALGVNPQLAQALVSAALPTVLASLGGAAATPAGAQRLADQIGAQDPGVLDNLGQTLAGPGSADLASAGGAALSSILGGGGLSGVAGALARVTGAHATQAESMLGMLTPVALAAVGRQDPSNWSSASGVASLFAGQRDAIQHAMPAGLGSALAGAGVPALTNLTSLGASAREAAAGAASAAQRQAQATAASARETAREAEAAASSAPGWLIPAALIVVLAGAAWWFMGRSQTPAPTPIAPAATAPAKPIPAPAPAQQAAPAAPAAPATPAAPDVAATAANVATATVGALQQTLAGVTDVATARAAAPKLQDLATQVDKASAAIAVLPDGARKLVATQVAPAVGKVDEQLGRLLAIPGVGDVLKPIVDPISARLHALAGG
jgi:hypothetical protein